MRMCLRVGMAVAAGLLSVGVVVGAATAAPVVSRIDLGTLGGQYGGVYGVNDVGEAVGSSTRLGTPENATGIDEHAIYASPGSGLQALARPADAVMSWGSDINNVSAIAGAYIDGAGIAHALYWANPQNSPLDLGLRRTANTINDLGVVGGSVVGGGAPWLWDRDTGFTDLPLDGGELWSVNNLGQAVGSGLTFENPLSRPFLWDPEDGLRWLSEERGVAYGISDGGYIVGTLDTDGSRVAVRWQPDLTVGYFPMAGPGEAWAVNGTGQVVVNVDDLAYVWEADGSVLDLGARAAWAISNRDPVAGALTVGGMGPDSGAALWRVTYPPPPIGDVLAHLRSKVDAATVGSGLAGKLETVARSLADDRPDVAANQLEAFIRQVGAMLDAGKLPLDAADWVEDAEALLARLQPST